MADNVTLNAGSGGVDLATDDIASVHYPISKLAHGALDSATLVSTASGLPVQQQGTFTVDLGATDNAVLDAIEADTTTIAGAVSGSEMQVDVVAPLPAGTNNIGDVDVLSFPTAVHSEDFDTGAGTDNTHAFGIAVPASGGAVVVPGDATAGLKVDLGADNDVTVTGTVTANLSATDNAVLDTIATNTGTVAGAVSGSEMQVDVVSSALPSGAATAANQLPDGHNVTVDNASGAAAVNIQDGGNSITVDGTVTAELSATDNAVLDTIAAGFAAEAAALGSGVLIQGDDGTDRTNVLVDTDGHLQVDVLTGGGAGTEYNEDEATPATITGTATMMERDDALGTLTPIEGDWVSMRATAEGALWVQDFNSDAILADTANIDTNMATVAGAVSGSEMQVDVVTSALPTGAATAANQSTANTALSGIQTAVEIIDNAISGSEMQVDVVGALPAGTNSVGNVGIIPRTSGGMSIFRSIDIDESEEQIKATAGQLFSISAFNTTAAPLFLKFYNATAASVTVGTTTPVLTFVVPANADSDGAGFIWNNDIGFAFSTAMTVACTTGVADADTGAPGANACIVNIGYA